MTTFLDSRIRENSISDGGNGLDESGAVLMICQPMGFCAGVERAVEVVELALIKYGAPLYVRHEIVHNKYVVESLRSRGVVFIENIDEVPYGANIIFSAHGVSLNVEQEAAARNLNVIDATCPLVKKVHNEIVRRDASGKDVILIGHLGHPEVEGTKGRIPNANVRVVSSIQDVENLDIQSESISYVTQTTLSVDDTKDIVEALKYKYNDIEGPGIADICYATQNRQDAVKRMVKEFQPDVLIVVGSKNSSNSNRLKDIGGASGVQSYLIDSKNDLNETVLKNALKIGLTAGASAPKKLVDEIIDAIKYMIPKIEICHQIGIQEDVKFKLPKEVL